MKISIAKKLEEKGMTRYELAKRIGVTYPTIDNIYKETSTSIKFEILESICKELECTLDEIIIPEDPCVKRLMAYQNNFKTLDEAKNFLASQKHLAALSLTENPLSELDIITIANVIYNNK